VTGDPLIKMSPLVGSSSPYRIDINVDLPAPFSPTRAWISPGRRVMSTESLARTHWLHLADVAHLHSQSS
jgi:hypothetical protein